jgi:hypothetical protein
MGPLTPRWIQPCCECGLLCAADASCKQAFDTGSAEEAGGKVEGGKSWWQWWVDDPDLVRLTGVSIKVLPNGRADEDEDGVPRRPSQAHRYTGVEAMLEHIKTLLAEHQPDAILGT